MVTALADDLNTPQALAGLHELANQLRKASNPQEADAAESISNEEIDAKIQARQDARKNGDYQLADDLRDELAAAGIELEDSREGTRWRRL